MQFRFSPGQGPGSSSTAAPKPCAKREPVDSAGVMDRAELRALGAAVREVRARRGLSQEELGFAGGLHRNYVGATLSGLFVFAKAPYRRWAVVNPCEGVDLPALPDRNEIR